ncbi:MAG: FAD-binding oxidoreductase [Phycisphaerales bacterium]|nr:FAD-binding oxidoreductase [Phycisphaerales bacterium]
MRIGVIGTGVVGLSSAVSLRRAGFADVRVLFKDALPDITSSRAGAVFTPFDAGGGGHDEWICESLRAFRSLALNEPNAGVRIGTAHEYLLPGGAEPRWTRLIGGSRPIEPRGPYGGGFRIDVPMMDMRIYLPWLRAQALSLGVLFEQRCVESFDELFLQGFDAIVNCAALGAGRLCRDPAVRPMRGQLLHVANTLSLTDAIAAPESDGGVTYIYPFNDRVVLGGTYELDQHRCETDDTSIAEILVRARRLLQVHGVPAADRLGETTLSRVAGLRPARLIDGRNEEVRLEVERTPRGPIIHNYGHGRAGVTLSWGCAEAATALMPR